MENRTVTLPTTFFPYSKDVSEEMRRSSPSCMTTIPEEYVGYVRDKSKSEAGSSIPGVPPLVVLNPTNCMPPPLTLEKGNEGKSSAYELYGCSRLGSRKRDGKGNYPYDLLSREKELHLTSDSYLSPSSSLPIVRGGNDDEDDDDEQQRIEAKNHFKQKYTTLEYSPSPSIPLHCDHHYNMDSPCFSPITWGMDSDEIDPLEVAPHLYPSFRAFQSLPLSSPQSKEAKKGAIYVLQRKIERLQQHQWMDRQYFAQYSQLFLVAQETGMRRELRCKEKQKRAELQLQFWQSLISSLGLGSFMHFHRVEGFETVPTADCKWSCAPSFVSSTSSSRGGGLQAGVSSAASISASIQEEENIRRSNHFKDQEKQEKSQRDEFEQSRRGVKGGTSLLCGPLASCGPRLPSSPAPSSPCTHHGFSPLPCNPYMDTKRSDGHSHCGGSRGESSVGLSSCPSVYPQDSELCNHSVEGTHTALGTKEKNVTLIPSSDVSSSLVPPSRSYLAPHVDSSAGERTPLPRNTNHHPALQGESCISLLSRNENHNHSHRSLLSDSIYSNKTMPLDEKEKNNVMKEWSTTVAILEERVRGLSEDLSNETALTSDMQEEIDDLMLQELVLLEESTRAKIEKSCVEAGMSLLLDEKKKWMERAAPYVSSSFVKK